MAVTLDSDPEVVHRQSARASRVEFATLAGLVLLHLALSAAYAWVVPWGEAPDEPAHLRYVEHIVRFRALPAITANNPYTNEAQHPPLYYLLGALAVWTTRLPPGGEPLDAPLHAAVRFNPDVLDPAKQPVYNVLTHDPADRFPFYAYLLRGLSIVLGIGTILLTYAAARRLVPSPASPLVPTLAALFLTFNPERLFIGASVSNENLSTLFAAWLCLVIVTRLKQPAAEPGSPNHLRVPALMGIALGLGVLSKFSVASFVPVLVWVLWVSCRGSMRPFLRELAIVASISALLAGPFLLYNTLSYGDPMASRAVAAMLPADSHFTLSDLFWLKEPFARFLWTSFWGVFGWQRIWMPEWFYTIFAVLTVAGVAGGARLLLSRALHPPQIQACAAFLGHSLLIYIAIVLYSLRIIAWQGRELFPALPGLSILLGIGVAGLVFGRSATGNGVAPAARRPLHLAISMAALAILLTLSLYALSTLNAVFSPLWLTD